MRSLFVLLSTFGYVYGLVEFTKIYYGEINLPEDVDTAVKNNWHIVGKKDERLKVTWYSAAQDGMIQLAYDGRKGLAAARLAILKAGVNDFYSKSKIFEEETIDGKAFYISTIFLTDPEFLQRSKDGRRKTPDDEIVDSVTVKRKDGNERIQRNACENAAQEVFQEQGCKNKYGLVFLPHQSANCDYPLYLVYNEEYQGEMLGFGWLVPSTDVAHSRTLTEEDIQELFPSAPSCLRGKAVVDVWLAKEARESVACGVPQGQFLDTRCRLRRHGPGTANTARRMN